MLLERNGLCDAGSHLCLGASFLNLPSTLSIVIYMYSTHVFLRVPTRHYSYKHFSPLVTYVIGEVER